MVGDIGYRTQNVPGVCWSSFNIKDNETIASVTGSVDQDGYLCDFGFVLISI